MPNPDKAPGQRLLASEFNLLDNAVDDLQTPPAASLYRSTAQSLANATITAILFDAEEEDTDNGHSTSTNTSRYIAARAGLYLVSGNVNFAANGTGLRWVAVAKNGAEVRAGSATTPGTTNAVGSRIVTPVKVVRLAVNDYVELQAWQDSGGSLSTAVASGASAGLGVAWLRA